MGKILSFLSESVFKKTLRENKKKILIFFLFFPVLGISIFKCAMPKIRNWPGDSREYYLMSYALYKNKSPDIRQENLQQILEYHDKRVGIFQPLNEFRDYKLADNVFAKICYFRAKDGHFYNYHFWLYTLLNVPALALMIALNFTMFNSFFLTNILCIYFATGVVIFSHYKTTEKLLLLSLFYLGSVFYFFFWACPEVFTASFFLSALVLSKEKKYLFSGFCAALAASQNPPIGIFVLCVCVLDYWTKTIKIGKKIPSFRFLFHWFIIGVLLLSSPLFFLWKFGVPNLTSAMQWQDVKNISVHRVLTIFFDLNQGMILVIPGVFILLSLFFILKLIHFKKFKAHLSVSAVFIVLCLILTFVSVSNICLNSGCSIMMRYCSWLMLPLFFALLELMKEIRWKNCLFTFLIISQIFVFWGNRKINYDQMEFSPIAKFILKKMPDLYNPLPEIFAIRGTQELKWALVLPDCYLKGEIGLLESGSKDIYFLVQNGLIKKLLFHETDIEELKKIEEYFLKQKLPFDRQITSERGWRYINCSIPLKASLWDGIYSLFAFDRAPTLEINKRYYATTPEIFSKGWDGNPNYWSQRGESILSFRLRSKENLPVKMTIFGDGETINNQRIVIKSKDVILFDGIYDREDAISFNVPTALLDFDGGLNIFSFQCITKNCGRRPAWHEFSCRSLLLERSDSTAAVESFSGILKGAQSTDDTIFFSRGISFQPVLKVSALENKAVSASSPSLLSDEDSQ
jgi:hypothetical protein